VIALTQVAYDITALKCDRNFKRMAVANKNTHGPFRFDSPPLVGKEVAAKHYVALAAEIRTQKAAKRLQIYCRSLNGNQCLRK
jgi:hypothetical protein